MQIGTIIPRTMARLIPMQVVLWMNQVSTNMVGPPPSLRRLKKMKKSWTIFLSIQTGAISKTAPQSRPKTTTRTHLLTSQQSHNSLHKTRTHQRKVIQLELLTWMTFLGPAHYKRHRRKRASNSFSSSKSLPQVMICSIYLAVLILLQHLHNNNLKLLNQVLTSSMAIWLNPKSIETNLLLRKINSSSTSKAIHSLNLLLEVPNSRSIIRLSSRTTHQIHLHLWRTTLVIRCRCRQRHRIHTST